MKTNDKYTTPYKHLPTYCLKMKVDRIDDLMDKIAEGTLTDEDFNHIKGILREMQFCCENLYNERKQNKKEGTN